MYVDNITEKDPIVAGAHQELSFTVYTDATTNAQVLAGTGVPQNLTGYTLRWRLVESLTGVMSLEKVAVVSGAHNVDPAINTQKAIVTLLSTDTSLLAPGVYRHGLWRTDSSAETPLTTGSAIVVAVP